MPAWILILLSVTGGLFLLAAFLVALRRLFLHRRAKLCFEKISGSDQRLPASISVRELEGLFAAEFIAAVHRFKTWTDAAVSTDMYIPAGDRAVLDLFYSSGVFAKIPSVRWLRAEDKLLDLFPKIHFLLQILPATEVRVAMHLPAFDTLEVGLVVEDDLRELGTFKLPAVSPITRESLLDLARQAALAYAQISARGRVDESGLAVQSFMQRAFSVLDGNTRISELGVFEFEQLERGLSRAIEAGHTAQSRLVPTFNLGIAYYFRQRRRADIAKARQHLEAAIRLAIAAREEAAALGEASARTRELDDANREILGLAHCGLAASCSQEVHRFGADGSEQSCAALRAMAIEHAARGRQILDGTELEHHGLHAAAFAEHCAEAVLPHEHETCPTTWAASTRKSLQKAEALYGEIIRRWPRSHEQAYCNLGYVQMREARLLFLIGELAACRAALDKARATMRVLLQDATWVRNQISVRYTRANLANTDRLESLLPPASPVHGDATQRATMLLNRAEQQYMALFTENPHYVEAENELACTFLTRWYSNQKLEDYNRFYRYHLEALHGHQHTVIRQNKLIRVVLDVLWELAFPRHWTLRQIVDWSRWESEEGSADALREWSDFITGLRNHFALGR